MHQRDTLLDFMMDQMEEQAVVFLDKAGIILEWSKGAEEIYGYSKDEVIGKLGSLMFTTEDIERGIFEHELQVAGTGGRMEDDRWMKRKDGQKIWVTGIVKALNDQAGSHCAYCKVMRNRTDLKIRNDTLDVEASVLRSNEQRNKQMLAVLAHEMRNAIAPIATASDALSIILPDDADVSPLISIQRRHLESLSRLVNDFLDVTRIEQGKLHCELTIVDITALLKNLEEDFRAEIAGRHQRLWLHLPNTSIYVRGDPTRLMQVFSNILRNAIKYTPEHGTIYVRATRDADAIVTIEDNGIGISPEMLPKIFDLFTQEDTEEVREQHGLGIGLALVKEIVSLHHGTVQAKSDGKNKGSIFSVQLPLAE